MNIWQLNAACNGIIISEYFEKKRRFRPNFYIHEVTSKRAENVKLHADARQKEGESVAAHIND